MRSEERTIRMTGKKHCVRHGGLLWLLAAVLLAAFCVGASAATATSAAVYYLADGGTGNGSSAAAAGGSLADAYAALPDGGTIVVCGPYTVAGTFTGAKHREKVTITSVYGGVDFAAAHGARLRFRGNFYCSGDTVFERITLAADGTYLSVFGGNHALTLGEGITSEKVGDSQYLSVMGGSRSVYRNAASDLTIRSGVWQRVRGGTAASGSKNYRIRLTVEGGTFIERLTLGDSGSHDGDITAEIRGGSFRQGIFAATLASADDSFSGSVSLVLDGGVFYGRIAPCASAVGSYAGRFDVTVRGGEFAHLVGFSGSGGLSGSMTSALQSSIDLSDLEVGTYTFQNYVRADGADPWLFYKDGYYYYTSTTAAAEVKLVRVANIGDLIYSGGTTIYKPESGKPWSDSSWSPEIHYYSDAEIGEGNGGWYCYLAGAEKNETAAGVITSHRMYVIKCLDGDDLLGRWGNPLTGEVNVPLRVTAPDMPGFDDTWAAGMTDIRIGGKVYTMYVTLVEDGDGKRHQTINILPMTNPWTLTGTSRVICEPEYDWEIGNHQKLYIVECGTPVYAPDGSIFIVYSACGYSTPDYKLGQMKYLGGDPTEKSNWQKGSTPILSKSAAISGCGSACYVTDTSGQGWICYNAYLSPRAVGARHAFVEPYTATAGGGVVIGDGTGHPADIGKVYTAAVNPMPLADKLSGFDYVQNGAASNRFPLFRDYAGFADVQAADWFYPYVRDAYRMGLVNGTGDGRFAPNGSFTVAEALTAAANMHAGYHGRVVPHADAANWYDPYVAYCIENGIIAAGQFADVARPITRGEMAAVFAVVLPASAYAPVRVGTLPDAGTDALHAAAVKTLYRAGIVGGDEKGNYNPHTGIRRSEVCVLLGRLANQQKRIG